MTQKQDSAIAILKAYRTQYEYAVSAYGSKRFARKANNKQKTAKNHFKWHCYNLKNEIDSALNKASHDDINCWPLVSRILAIHDQFEMSQNKVPPRSCCLWLHHKANRSFHHLYRKHISRVTLFLRKIIFSECNGFFNRQNAPSSEGHFLAIMKYICDSNNKHANYRYSVFGTPFASDFSRVEDRIEEIISNITFNMNEISLEGKSRKSRRNTDVYLELSTLRV